MTDKPPKGAVASAEDFRVQRDDTGDLLPIWEPIPGAETSCPECEGTGVVPSDDDEETPFTECDHCNGEETVPKMARVIPMTQGTAEAYLPSSGNPNDLSDRQAAKLFNEFYVQPAFDIDVSNAKDEMDDFKGFAVEPLVFCLFNASGFEYARGMILDNAELTQAVEGNSKTGN